jgi:hypothetical protein
LYPGGIRADRPPVRSKPTDCYIDALVYELYGLTEEEIKIVETNSAYNLHLF